MPPVVPALTHQFIRRWGAMPLFSCMAALALTLLWSARAADYLVDVWDTENNLPNSSVTAIAQTPDGYLWVGTYNGLARFDGVRFVTFDPVNTPALGHARIQDLFLDSSGTLWINTYRGGLTSYHDGVFRREWQGRGEFDIHTALVASSAKETVFVTQFGEVLRRTAGPGTNATWASSSPAGGNRTLFQCRDAEGTLWFLTRDSHIVRYTGGEFQPLPDACGLAGTHIGALAADAQGHVWAATDRELALWDGHLFQTMTPTNDEPVLQPTHLLPTRDGGVWVLSDGRLRKAVARRWVAEATEWRGLLGWASGRSMGMHEDREGGVWLNHYGNGLFHITPDGKFQRSTTLDGLPSDRVWAWFQGREGEVWVGVDRGGLTRLRERQFQVIGPGEGLPARATLSVCEDSAGAMWFGTSGGGLCRWRAGQLQSFAVGNDPSANFVFSVYPRAGQGLWLSAAAGEDWDGFQDGQAARAPWEVHGVKAILTDRSGRVWLGTKSGLSWWLPEQRRNFRAADGMSLSAVRALAEGPDGTIWCGNDEGTLYRCEPGRVVAFKPADALANQPIWSLLAEPDGTLWVGTFRGGLLRFRAGKFARLTTEQGLPNDVISEILPDGKGQLWLGTHKGICRVAKSALNTCLAGESKRVDCVSYGRQDGLPTLECAGNYQPACWRAHDGRLWFATVKGVVSIKPEELKNNPVPPPVVIEEFRVDGERLAVNGGPLIVPPGRKQFEFRFTALSFIASDKIRFRYRLDGSDKNWIEAEGPREARYSPLAAGEYKFRVLACNNDGVWNQLGSQVAFTVQPYFYERWWFVLLVCATVVGGVAAVVRAVTTRKYRAALAGLAQQHAIERDRARIAKDIHDDLGAGLTQITLLSELARREPSGAGAHLDRITGSARQMTRAMDEIVWAVDPQHDTLHGLIDYISAYTEDFLRTAGIPCRMDLPLELPGLRVDAEQRYNLFLALKEALNNIIKHAQATEVWLRLRLEPRGITLVVEDNGKGFPAALLSGTALPLRRGEGESDRIQSGHGLGNLEKRLAAIGGHCRVHSAAGEGTRVEMTIRVEPPASPIVVTGQNHSEQTN